MCRYQKSHSCVMSKICRFYSDAYLNVLIHLSATQDIFENDETKRL